MTRKTQIRRHAAPSAELSRDIAASLQAGRPRRRGRAKSWRTILLDALDRPVAVPRAARGGQAPLNAQAECHHVDASRMHAQGAEAMGTVTIRNLDDEVIERAKQRAKAHNRSLEAELRTILTREFKPLSAEEFFKLADEIRERTRGRSRLDSGTLQREGRDWLDAKAERLARGADEP
jgi:plasmid stability protein